MNALETREPGGLYSLLPLLVFVTRFSGINENSRQLFTVVDGLSN